MRWLMVAVLLAAPETKPSRDQAMRQLIERQSQIASLLTAGRLAWDAGDFSTAAARWEALLRVDGLPADVERAVRPFAVEARSNAGGAQTTVKFDKPGVIELLCNIHASMLGYLVVVDTPWYAVADGSGAFQIRNVPPGEYEAAVWHESANTTLKRKVTVAEGSQLAF